MLLWKERGGLERGEVTFDQHLGETISHIGGLNKKCHPQCQAFNTWSLVWWRCWKQLGGKAYQVGQALA